MTQKHTPGPWAQEGTVVYIGKTGDFLPNGEPNWGGFDLRNCPLPEANAHLIAAAPELLEALENLLAYSADGSFLSHDPEGDMLEMKSTTLRSKLDRLKRDGKIYTEQATVTHKHDFRCNVWFCVD